jgi:hypothetical protein
MLIHQLLFTIYFLLVFILPENLYSSASRAAVRIVYNFVNMLYLAFLFVLPAIARLEPRQTATIPEFVRKYGRCIQLDDTVSIY